MLKKYKMFIRVAELGNLTMVAEELNYTQSAISHAIRSLEDDIGLPLIYRTKNGIKLTQYGDALLPEFRRIVLDNELLLQKSAEFKGLHQGTLKIGSFTSVSYNWIPSIVKRINDEYPNIKFIQSHSSYKGVYDDIVQDRIDIGFLSEKSKSDLDFMPLYEDEYILVMPENHPLVNYEKMPLEALEGSNLIMMDEGGDFDAMKIASLIPDAKIIHWVNEDMLAIPLVEQGIGIAILPRLIVKNIVTHAVIKEFTSPKKRIIGLAAKNFNYISPLAKLFVSITEEYLHGEIADPVTDIQ